MCDRWPSKPYTLYLAGSMMGRPGREVLAERRIARAACANNDLGYIDPAEGENIPEDDTLIDTRSTFATMKNFVAKDEQAIRDCDALLILTGDTPSEGTGLEFGLALQLGKPVFLISPKRCRGERNGFWSVKSTAIFETVEEATQFISENFAEEG